MSAYLRTHGDHDEIFNFIGVERTALKLMHICSAMQMI